MPTGRDHFALDWIKADLLELLNDVRVALDAYAEQDDETRLPVCLSGMQQVHGTLVMLELKGVTLLADHLAQLAQAMVSGEVADPAAASQILVQGILELPGYLEELGQGADDGVGAFIPLVNDARALLGVEGLQDPAGPSLLEPPANSVIERFAEIDGPAKVARIRSVYQNVLLSILKGEDRSKAIDVLQKIAIGLERVCKGSALARQWQGFGGFVLSLKDGEGALDPEEVKLLRCVDLEIKAIVKEGASGLRRPANVELLEQLLTVVIEGGHQTAELEGLHQAVTRDLKNTGLAISGRQAMATAATALKEELAIVKDRLDLLVRSEAVDLDELKQLAAPCQKIGSTLSMLGFESSNAIIVDQVDALERFVDLRKADPQVIHSIASALVQVDENLSSVAQGNAQTEVDRITSEAQLQLLREARKGLGFVMQSVVDFVKTHWDTRHLAESAATIAGICGALAIVPLKRPAAQLKLVGAYISDKLMQGHRPDVAELDLLADAVSALDYYLECLSEENPAGAEEILVVAEQSLTQLDAVAAEIEPEADASAPVSTDAPVQVNAIIQAASGFANVTTDATIGAASESKEASEPSFTSELLTLDSEPRSVDEVASPEALSLEPFPDGVKPSQPLSEESPTPLLAAEDRVAEAEGEPDLTVTSGIPSALPEVGDLRNEELVDTVMIVEREDAPLELEIDDNFDLSSDAFAGLEGTLEGGTQAASTGNAPVANEPNTVAGPDPIEGMRHDDTSAQEPLEQGTAASVVAHEESALDGDALLEGLTAQTPEEIAEKITEEVVDELAEGPDPEVVEIFVEEVDEVLATIDDFLPQWAVTLTEGEPLDELRRAFHTLKGSGRMVLALSIGELGWAVENMLNRVLEGTVTGTQQFVDLMREAREDIPPLLESFASGKDQGIDSVAHLIEKADILASGGALQAQESAISETSDEATAGKTEELPSVEEFAEASADSGELELFLSEAREHLDTLERENAADTWCISAALTRAMHTLSGSVAIVEADGIRFIAAPANQVVEAFRAQEPNDALKDFFLTTARHLRECVVALETGVEWEEPFEFVALADDLIARRGKPKRPMDELLRSPAVSTLFNGEALLAGLLQGKVEQKSLLVDALYEIAELATAASADTIAPLASELANVLVATTEGAAVQARVSAALVEAYEALIDQFNAFAAGGSGLDTTATVAIRQELGLYVAERTEAEVVAQEVVAEEAPLEVEDALAVSQALPQAAQGIDLSDLDPDLADVFIEEAEELAEEIEGNIVSWADEQANRLYMENLLRALHTLKGGARLCGLSSLGDMAHDYETLVIEVQSNERDIDAALFVELERRYDQVTQFVADVKEQIEGGVLVQTDTVDRDAKVAAEESRDAPASAPEDRTASAVAPPQVDDVPQVAIPPVAAKPDVLAEVIELAAAGHRDVAKDVEPTTIPQTQSPQPADDSGRKKDDPRRSQEMVRVGSGLLEELVNLAGENSILRARIEQGMSDFMGSLDEMETTIERVREQLRRLEIETETQVLFRHERADGPDYENFDPLEMDRYSQLQQLSRGLSESASDMLDLKDTLLFKARESETLLLQQARINTELQEGLMRTRMVPFSSLLPRLRRIVRQVAAELDKDIEFHVQNGEGELDRNLLERMVPALEHMLRNAVDHGIESAEMHRNFGKSPKGRIDLRLSREGGNVVLEIIDDGAGVDVESVRAKAIERGLMAADAKLSDEEVSQFVLAPGFSTAKRVTQISGRGVGMDVVHSEVKQLGGTINIVSHVGKGSRFVVQVPFAVSVNRALMVSVADDLYALPLNTIEGVVLLSSEQLQGSYSSETKTFDYAGIPYRVRYLGQYLGREFDAPAAGQSSVPVVLVRSGDHAVAIHVDAIQGSREIVVKSLGPQFAGVGGISGATILRDGSVVVILDLIALIRAHQHRRVNSKQPRLSQPGRRRCVMVVDDSVTVRKVTSRLLERQGMDVLLAKDGIEAVALLQERRPDVMLLDIEMPRMDGFEVARQVRHDVRLVNLPIVMISSRTGDKHKEHATELGVNRFLGKPFQENELLATIDELVTR